MNISRLAELALAQITDMTLENFNLRMSLEGEREHVAFLEGQVDELEGLLSDAEAIINKFPIVTARPWPPYKPLDRLESESIGMSVKREEKEQEPC